MAANVKDKEAFQRLNYLYQVRERPSDHAGGKKALIYKPCVYKWIDWMNTLAVVRTVAQIQQLLLARKYNSPGEAFIFVAPLMAPLEPPK